MKPKPKWTGIPHKQIGHTEYMRQYRALLKQKAIKKWTDKIPPQDRETT